MDERDVTELLRELPRLRASASFAEEVRNRVRGVSPRRRWKRIALPAFAAAAAFAGIVVLRLDSLRREREIRQETRALALEIEQMKKALPSPLVEVGGEDGARYVVDLRKLPGRRDGVL